MDTLTRILTTIPVIHPATVGRLIELPNDDLPEEQRMREVSSYIGHTWMQIHQRAATTQDVVAWGRRQVPMPWTALALRLSSSQLPGIWNEIEAWVARGIIQPMPPPVADPGPGAAVMMARLLKM